MRPVYMSSTMHSPENGLFGECMRACVASIFELTLEEVPHFANEWQHPEGMSPQEGLEFKLREWLEPQGLTMMFFRVPLEDMDEAQKGFVDAGMDAHYLVGGVSINGVRHTCVGKLGEVAHDPYPDMEDPNRGVLLPDPETGSFELGFFVKR
jgi:hypothetical protein